MILTIFKFCSFVVFKVSVEHKIIPFRPAKEISISVLLYSVGILKQAFSAQLIKYEIFPNLDISWIDLLTKFESVISPIKLL